MIWDVSSLIMVIYDMAMIPMFAFTFPDTLGSFRVAANELRKRRRNGGPRNGIAKGSRHRRRLHNAAADIFIVIQQMQCHRGRARRFAEQRDRVWITAEKCDILRNPIDGEHLILESEVAEDACAEGVVVEEAEESESVINGDDNDIANRIDHRSTVVHEKGGRARKEGAPVDPQHHGE